VEKVVPIVVAVFTTQTVSHGLTAYPFSDDALRKDNANKRCKASAQV